MKILKKPDSNWSYKHTCKSCDADLEVEKGDVRYTYNAGDFRDPGYETWTANCPCCSATIDVPVAKIPKIVQVEIKKSAPSSGGGYYDR